MRLFTELPLDEIARLEALRGSEINVAKKVLADAVTRLCHGADAATQASETSRRMFEEGEAAAGLPTVAIEGDLLRQGLPLPDALVASGLARSKSEARRLILGGGVRVNSSNVSDEAMRLTDTDTEEGVIRLSVGRKKHVLLQPEP